MNTRRTRWAALAGAAMVVAASVAAQLAGAAPASAVGGLQRTSALSATNSASTKTVTALCPAGKVVTGGGGWAFAVAAADATKVSLTEVRPYRSSARTGFTATGWETTTAMTGNWWLEAYAICADPGAVPGYEIVVGASTVSSQTRQTAVAACPAGKRALGTGAWINNPGGQVGLQVARASGTGDIARAEAREDANGYAGDWQVAAYAMCANTPAGYQVVYGESTARDSETEKVAFAYCPSGKRLHGAGGAISNLAPSGVSLQVVYPSANLDWAEAAAVENTPTSADWDFIVAQAICAY